MEEKTLVLIKPDAITHAGEIIEIFDQNGLKVLNYKFMSLDEEIIKEHYAHLINKPFFPKLKEFMMSKPVLALILTGDNAVSKTRKLIGKTNSKEAEEGTIRNMFGTDATMNAVHASDSIENAEIEINRFFGLKKSINQDLTNTKTLKTKKM